MLKWCEIESQILNKGETPRVTVVGGWNNTKYKI